MWPCILWPLPPYRNAYCIASSPSWQMPGSSWAERNRKEHMQVRKGRMGWFQTPTRWGYAVGELSIVEKTAVTSCRGQKKASYLRKWKYWHYSWKKRGCPGVQTHGWAGVGFLSVCKRSSLQQQWGKVTVWLSWCLILTNKKNIWKYFLEEDFPPFIFLEVFTSMA